MQEIVDICSKVIRLMILTLAPLTKISTLLMNIRNFAAEVNNECTEKLATSLRN